MGINRGFFFNFARRVLFKGRLRQSQDLGEILDVQFGGRQQGQNAQTRGLSRRTERGEGVSTGQTWDGLPAVGFV